MSLTTLTEEAFQAEVEAAPPGTDVTINAEIAGGQVKFSTPVFVEGIEAFDSVIRVTKPSASFNLQITLATPGFTFQPGVPAILWATPPQRGYESNPFGTSPIFPSSSTVAVIPNTTGPKGSPKLTTQFALVLVLVDSANDVEVAVRSVIIDPTIIDDPNT